MNFQFAARILIEVKALLPHRHDHLEAISRVSSVEKKGRAMTFKSILVHFDIDASPEKRAELVLELANGFDAELQCLSSAEPLSPFAAGRSAALTMNIMRRDVAAIEARQRDLHEHIMQHGPFRNHVEWRAEVADPTTTIIERACCADLIVLFRLDKGQADDRQRTADQGAVLLAAGRPLLIPSPTMEGLKAHTIVVAWKDTRETRRAVADALPLLRQAQDVVLLTVLEADGNADPPRDAMHNLQRHNVKVRSIVEPMQPASIGETIVDVATKIEADLIVAGGYGHSRFREWILGGATQHLLQHCPLHLLLSN